MVAASTTILELSSKPSISINNWFKVCFFSELKFSWPSLYFPIESISSINIIAGDKAFASLNIFLTFSAPIPTYFYTKSEPEAYKKDIPDSLAHALANNVFPVPGGPVNKAPFGILAPN